MTTLDCRDLQCPRPVLETRKHLLDHPGEAVTVLVADEIAQANVSRLAAKEGYQVSAEKMEDGIRLNLALAADFQCQISETADATANNVVYIASACMGQGADELGEVLMRNFIFTLGEVHPLPKAILFVNSGVKLTCNGSAVLEALEKLAHAGVEIASCGLCLEFFGLKEQLQIGRVSNMLETVEALSAADRIINP
ncbi:MAG: sulfurtransferase-like selenium metabolism protein YedF [Desulfuromonadaceae bacterium]|nr:sulfurtransferase-like selenium metabolism protein YedF [Desulfuromonadaceae bacterium]